MHIFKVFAFAEKHFPWREGQLEVEISVSFLENVQDLKVWQCEPPIMAPAGHGSGMHVGEELVPEISLSDEC